ncbi:NADH-dependent flavin oxidoreductase [Paenibacillus agilis]|uniref:NADH-dependent flavin oxidoreductase n=1 Tax=Paenibacillus agilis TaxID=3020863 RepID=A0A559IXQ5_9BACL|nr:NADH-dependent flavin oxidoreductase [Paenibacillus agilis]TVX92420.1 NADH-dependent flavin oxidoreductase [Paenibacillus agilis]
MSKRYERLFQNFTFNSGVQVRNRLMMAPMTTFSADQHDYVSEEELDYYRLRANGVGTVITACAYVSKSGKGFDGQMAIDHDGTIDGLTRLAKVIQEGGAKAVVQLYHGGRLAVPRLVPNQETLSASNVAPLLDRGFYSIDQAPKALSHEEVLQVIHDFGEATRRAIIAGFDGIELHGASGYLLQQFVSPHSNRRQDNWGGSEAKRLNFSLAIIEEVKRVIAEYATKPFLVGYRFSPEEPETPGITMKETFGLVEALIEHQLDYVHLASTDAWAKPRRGVTSESSRMELLAERINNRVPLIGVGSIHTADDALAVLEQANVPFVAIGRALVVDPQWVEKVHAGNESLITHTLKTSVQKEKSIPTPLWKLILSLEGWFPVEKDK